MTAARWERFVDTETGPGFVGWRDPELFEAWQARALELAQGGPALDATGDYAAQRRRVVELVEAVANCYRAVDTLAPSDPAYFKRYLGAWNGAGNAIVFPGEPGYGGAWLDGMTPTLYQPFSTVDVTVDRAFIGWNGAANVGALVRDPAAFAMEHNDGRSFSVFAPRAGLDWTRGFVTSECRDRGGFLGAGDCRYWSNFVLPPAVWEFWLWSEIQHGLRERSAWEVQRDAFVWSIMRNMAVAARWDIRGARADVTRILEEQAARSSEQVEADARVRAREQLAYLDAVTGLMALGGPVGALFGAIVAGIAHLLVEVVPIAEAFDSDVWGRREPSFTVWRLSGTAADPPTHDVAAPPGFERKPRGTIKILLPPSQTLPSARATIDNGEPHPSYVEQRVPAGLHVLAATADDRVSTSITARVEAGGEFVWRPNLVRITDPAYRVPPPRTSPGAVLVPVRLFLEGVEGDGAPRAGARRGGARTGPATRRGEAVTDGGDAGTGETMAGDGTHAELTVLVSGVEGAEVLLSPPAPDTPAGTWLSLPRTVRWPRAVSVRLAVRAPGRTTQAQDVDIDPGQKATVTVTDAALPRSRPWVKWILGAAGVVAAGGLVVVISQTRGRSDGVL